jgi:hypothetical protein
MKNQAKNEKDNEKRSERIRRVGEPGWASRFSIPCARSFTRSPSQQVCDRSASRASAGHQAPFDCSGLRQPHVRFRKNHLAPNSAGQTKMSFLNSTQTDSTFRAESVYTRQPELINMNTTKIIKTIFLLFVAAAGTGMSGTSKSFLSKELTAPWSAVTAVPQVGAMQAMRDNQSVNKILRGGDNVKIDLTTREVPPDGEQPGVFAEAVIVRKADKRNRHYNALVLIGELAATKSNGKKFVAAASFNLENARGINRLREMLKVWRGTNDLPDLSSFDPEQEFLGKGFLAQPAVEDKGGKRELRLARLKRGIGEPIAVSPDYVKTAQTVATE